LKEKTNNEIKLLAEAKEEKPCFPKSPDMEGLDMTLDLQTKNG
jgi:hypothetical protein